MKKRALCLNCGKYVKYNIEQAFDTIRTEKGNITYKRIIPKCRKCGEELYISKINEANLTRLDREYKKFNEDKVKYITDKDQEIARLTAENAALNARLEKAVELPKIGDEIYIIEDGYCDCTEVCEIHIQEKDTVIEWVQWDRSNYETPEFYDEGEVLMSEYNKTWFTDRAKAKACLAEIKGGEE